MIAISDDDLSSMDEFPLYWRWTDPKYNCLPSADLEHIRPLKPQRAAELDMKIRNLLGIPLRIVGETGAVLRSLAAAKDAVSFDATGDAIDGLNWLHATLPKEDCEVIVSWDPDMAVATRMSIFAKYWDDFCYPMSDDVVVVPMSCDWILYFWHEEQFVFCPL